MAAVTTDRVVQLFDDNGDKRDKFSTKPSNPDGPKNFVVRGMAFSPDSTKLAIAQSDNIVFVYKLGVEWGDKKSICNKFLQHHPVAALAWPQERHNEVVFALTDGKVKVGQLKTNKAATLYAHHEGSPAVSVASNPNGDAVCSGHQDGSVLTFSFATGAGARICAHSCVPYALSWGAGFVCAAGADRRVVFYDDRGEGHRTPAVFDHAGDPDQREFSCAAFNPPARRLWLARLTDSTRSRETRGGALGRKPGERMSLTCTPSPRSGGNRTDRNSPLERCAVWWMCTMRVFEGKDTATPSSSRTCRGRRWLSNDSPPARESSCDRTTATTCPRLTSEKIGSWWRALLRRSFSGIWRRAD